MNIQEQQGIFKKHTLAEAGGALSPVLSFSKERPKGIARNFRGARMGVCWRKIAF